jgi:FeS assembly SUF system protein
MEEKPFIPSIGGELNADKREHSDDEHPVKDQSIETNFPRLAEAIAKSEAEKATMGDGENLRDQIIDAIKTVYDPEIPVNIYELGLIYEVNIGPENKIDVVMTLTSPGCPAAGMLPGDVEEKVRSVPGTGDVKVEVTFEPPWDQSMMTDEAKLELGFM